MKPVTEKSSQAQLTDHLLTLVDGMCFEDYSIDSSNLTLKDKLSELYRIFKSEYVNDYTLKRYGSETNCFSEWLRGLPSFTVDYTNHEILARGYEFGFLKGALKPYGDCSKPEQAFIDSWFDRCSILVFKQFKKFEVTK